jgi:ribosome recycling factor
MDQVKTMNLPKDDERRTTQRAQTMHDDAIKGIEEKLKAKEKELK